VDVKNPHIAASKKQFQFVSAIKNIFLALVHEMKRNGLLGNSSERNVSS
jgi:hypothetical protein